MRTSLLGPSAPKKQATNVNVIKHIFVVESVFESRSFEFKSKLNRFVDFLTNYLSLLNKIQWNFSWLHFF